MGSSSGTSTDSSVLQNSGSGSGSEEDLQTMMELKKRKRMISNRESARRSRMRKQKHLDDLMAQVAQLRKDNQQIITNINITTQHFLTVEADNSVLRAQLDELSHRLQSLNDIIHFINTTNTGGFCDDDDNQTTHFDDNLLMMNNYSSNPFNHLPVFNQPIMVSPAPASVDMYYQW